MIGKAEDVAGFEPAPPLLARQGGIQSKSLPRLRLRFEMAVQPLLLGAKEPVFPPPPFFLPALLAGVPHDECKAPESRL